MQAKLDDLVTQAEAARIRGVSREAIYGLVARGKLTVTEIGGQKFLKRGEVERYEPEPGGRPASTPSVSEKVKKRTARKK